VQVIVRKMGVPGKSSSLKRLSRKLGAAVKSVSVKPAAAGRPVSDVEDSRGAALKESTALNEEGLRIIKNIADELEARVAEETRTNEDDVFSKGRIPGISIKDYLCRLARYINVWRSHAGGQESAGVRSAVMCLMYLRHLEELHEDFFINRENIHRLLMVGCLVATKWSEDRGISSEWWAKVAGVPQAEVNQLESAFCNKLNFELFCDDEAYTELLKTFDDVPEF